MPGIAYDESGSLAGYFGVTFLAVVLIPATWIVFRPAQKETIEPLCQCSDCRTSRAHIAQRKSSAHRRRFAKRIVPLLAAWALFVYLCYGVATAPRTPGGVVYNPFEILGLSDSSTEKQIKKHYKKLSLQFHPDKIKLAENQTQEEADSKFVELTKAYKALTDEVTRENLAKYGNPDGPQQREDKIAIPQWVVEGKNNIWVLGAYGLVLGGGIPYVVGRWWFSQRRHTRDGVLNPTAEHFFHTLREDTDFTNLLTILAGASELAAILHAKTRKMSKKERKDRQAKVEELEKDLEKAKENLGIEESPLMRKESKVAVSSAAARRARALLWAHLLRFEVDAEAKKGECPGATFGRFGQWPAETDALLREVQPILTALLNISLAHNWLATSLHCISLQPALVQALPPSVSPLAQLPGISPEQGFEQQVTNSAEGKRWLEKWVKADVEGCEEAKRVARSWPRLEIVSAEFKVPGEKVVPPSSVVQLICRLRYVYPTTSTTTASTTGLPNGIAAHSESKGDAVKSESAEPADYVAEVEDAVAKVTEDEETVDEKAEIKKQVEELKEKIVNGSEKKAEKVEKEVGTKGKAESKSERKWAPNGYAHAPRWPLLRKPHYQLFLGDSKLDKVIVPPIKITDIPLPLANGTPDEPREYTLTFPAPPQANLYSFVIHAASDTFLGANVEHPIMLKVEEPPEDSEYEDDEDDDISEPDEDTLAGQMAMMRGGKVKPSPVRAEGEDEDEDEDESEYESSSDEEGPKRKRAINEDSESDSD